MNNKLVILSIAAFSLTACKKEAPKQDGAKPFPVVSVESKNIVGYQTFPATIQGRVNNDVRAKIQGYITQLLVDEGQYVTKGQPLFRLETNILNENAAASKAGIGAAESTIAAAQASVNAAQLEVNKLKPLVQKNIISNVQLQTAQANLAQAQAQLQQAHAAKRQAEANYKGVEANIEYSIIRAPISGVVGRLPLKVGSLVGPSDQTPLTTISDTSQIYAYFAMNEKEYFNFLEKAPGASMPEKIKNLPMVELQLANGSLYPEKGRIEAITGQIDPTTGTIQFRVGFSNAQKLLSNGNSGTIRFPQRYDNVLVVPESATYEQQGIVYVYKIDKGDTARNVVINVIDRIDNMALIKSGVNKGETVIAAGIGGLKPGTAVKPKPIKMDSLVQSIKPKF
ncbi:MULTISPECIES: efflux RND transporter periplasmic adaptor subunit [Chryseobacterium]|uniref:Efflux RND transporter periplasmic adaptor subunit n=1 Tax=Chryseobacterium indologenes TaxID=253 RepID=A0A3G5Z473_CHRID|nr:MULTISPECIES: efflux RND transporter periplasmic adaptor subunit [Chryseobacterium]ATN05128.1 efflux RND transporter periplasmic adaptor subunit [Chryseobacterium indologenes]AYY86120.1 efflux RND transporter periplasmic adaptor subunit [Chryseobacterium indologenes]AZB16705.1 efflux RND transporter periplasmic adaptor subunit [Chryseobacterium indologenes]MBF6644671.1 efflux RND transporter periplasmic adaptor subunit [Chryseobacterium indologenes]MBU3049412.1 efflux RND transporter peripl